MKSMVSMRLISYYVASRIVTHNCPPAAAPEPHVLLFRRPKNFDVEQRKLELELEQQLEMQNVKAKAGGLAGRRK